MSGGPCHGYNSTVPAYGLKPFDPDLFAKRLVTDLKFGGSEMLDLAAALIRNTPFFEDHPELDKCLIEIDFVSLQEMQFARDDSDPTPNCADEFA